MEIPPPELDLTTLRPIKLLGEGAMGTVFLVRDPSSRHPFALKVVEKHPLQSKPDADRRAYRELDILARISSNHKPHPFLPSLLGSFESEEFWAWAVPFCPGGDLNVLRHRQTERAFSPSVIKFYAAEVVCALEQLHLMGIVYRDLKPENVLIQRSGHITLTDFDLSRTLTPKSIMTLIYSDSELMEDAPSPAPDQTPSRKSSYAIRPSLTRFLTFNSHHRQNKVAMVAGGGLKRAKSSRVSPVSRRNPAERSNSFVGTEEYVSPEVIRGEGHEFTVDWWALGILLYEMLYGITPFKGRNRKETFGKIVTMEAEFMGKPTALMDLIKKLLRKDPSRRLGSERGAAEIKEHEFFDGLRWDLLTEVVRPPFIPGRRGDDGNAAALECGNVREYFRRRRSLAMAMGSEEVVSRRRMGTPVGSPAREVGGAHVLSFPEF
uniref:non-specific serine/threonine protein kinase n=1 Tax=Kalanchoe fedtschenkoi TaxID=63787 RepID=A0A7N0ZWA1_KALFE